LFQITRNIPDGSENTDDSDSLNNSVKAPQQELNENGSSNKSKFKVFSCIIDIGFLFIYIVLFADYN
jgi:hypothetical protein